MRGFRVLMAFSFRAAPREAALFLLSGAIMSLATPAAAFGAKLLVDGVLNHDHGRLVVAAALLTTAAAISLVNVLYYVDLLFSVAEKAGAAVDRRLIELMAAVPGLEHHERPEYLDQLDLLREERGRLGWMTNATAGMVRVAVQLIASGVLLARLHPLLLLLPVAGGMSFIVGRKAQVLQIAASERTAEGERLRRHLFDTATSAAAGKELRVFGLTETLVERHRAAAADITSVRDTADIRGAWLQSIDGLVSGGAYVAAITFVLLRAIAGQATPGDVVLAIGLAAGMNGLVFTAVMYGTSFLGVLRTANRFLWLQDYVERATVPVTNPVSVPTRLTRGIDLDDVSFHYPGTATQILEGVSLHVPAGAVVAIVGDNGAGKTTLVKLLSRYYEPSAGALLVDGTDIRRFDVERWRSRISAAFQDFVRFEFLVRETVGVGDLPRMESRSSVTDALHRSGGVDLLTRLPDGLDTQLGREWGGAELSGGQWQKLALGRAMMREAPLLLVLDEPTASLDAEAEHELFERYAQMARETAASTGTITLLVSHRFSTVRMADLIVVIDGGRVRESGSHAELMRQGGLYAELYELQARQYR